MAGYLMALLMSASYVAEPPRLERIEPAQVAAYQPVTLRLYGGGFSPGARVFVEGHRPGLFVPHRPTVSDDVCEVVLPLGFGASPKSRRVYVESPDGARSQLLELRIGPVPVVALIEGGDEPPRTAGPAIEALRPESVPAGRPFVLEILGTGFAEGAVVEMTVNLHAGSSRLPEYAPQTFEADRVDDQLLEIELDRGFFPIPGLRDVVVINPDGGKSPAMALRIQPMEDLR